MNKKLLFFAMSLAALTACTENDFESQKKAEEVSSVQFEVINNNDAITRASMDGNTIVWSANDHDLFTLYHGVAALGVNNELAGYQNATYKADAEDGKSATLSTPSVINQGYAIMVWPVDTTFRTTYPANTLTIKIPVDQPADVENQIPYVSDLIDIDAYAAYSETGLGIPTAFRTAGKDRKYKIFMRPMASQLNLKAEYAGTDATLAALEAGDDGITPISVTSVELLTTVGGGGADNFTKEIPLQFTAKTAADNTRWNGKEPLNKWSHVTGFNKGTIVAGIGATQGQTDKLTTKSLTPGNKGGKFLILPQKAPVAGGVDDAGIVVNTTYGKLVIADPTALSPHDSKYTGSEYNAAWYRYVDATAKAAIVPAEEVAAATAGADGLFKATAVNPAMGMQQTLNYMSTYTRNSATSIVDTEPIGVALTRYVNVLLNHLDMSGLHVTSDKQLRDAARVWKQMNLDDVTVYLDGNGPEGAVNEFNISQKTIQTINEINASITGGTKSFKVKPCHGATASTPAEVCNYIVITGGGAIQDLRFIDKHEDGTLAKVALNAGENWQWAAGDAVLVNAADVESITNRGTLANAATATLQTREAPAPGAQNNIPFINAENATWNITAGTLNVQFDVTNNGTVNISKGAQYRQDGRAFNTVFVNDATAKPGRFGGNDAKIGVVNNSGVFATVNKAPNTADINNYGLIEHLDNDAKTYVTRNQTSTTATPAYAAEANFALPFSTGSTATPSTDNKMGRINLPYGNRGEDNVSISNAAPGTQQGFVSVTIAGEVTGNLAQTTDELGKYVNYVIVKSGPTGIASLSNKIKYLEVNMTDKSELAWSVASPTAFDGLMILTDVNIKQGTTVTVNQATYLGSDMYVGGTFNEGSWSGYYGNTSGNVETKYITY